MDVLIASVSVASSASGYPVRGFAGASASNGTVESFLRAPGKLPFERGNFSVDFSFSVDREFADCDEATEFCFTEALRVTGRRLVRLEMGDRAWTLTGIVGFGWEPNIGRTARVRYSVKGGIPVGEDTIAPELGGGGGATPLTIGDTDGDAIDDTDGDALEATY